MQRLLAVLLLVPGLAHACLFVTTTPPEGWYQWSERLFGGDVTAVAKDAGKPVDVISVKVVETFKGPEVSLATLEVRVPSRHWSLCKMEMPGTGTRVLVALNANSEVMLVPLSTDYADKLRALRR
jgi:hypothetical protein